MKRFRYGQYDPHNVDDLAVQFACNGTPMQLNRDETTVAAMRMVGKCSSTEIARRCHTDDRTIVRILHALGARKCSGCGQLVFTTDGVVDHHIDYRWLGQCAMSGRAAERELAEVSS